MLHLFLYCVCLCYYNTCYSTVNFFCTKDHMLPSMAMVCSVSSQDCVRWTVTCVWASLQTPPSCAKSRVLLSVRCLCGALGDPAPMKTVKTRPPRKVRSPSEDNSVIGDNCIHLFLNVYKIVRINYLNEPFCKKTKQKPCKMITKLANQISCR